MAYQYYRSPFGDTTFTKVFVGGLAWETPTDVMRRYFQQFGEILEAVIITDKITGNSKGYGFVTFRDPESARRACAEPNPVIDGRRANCNIASLGRPLPSPPRGRSHGGVVSEGTPPSSYRGVPPQLPPPPPPPAVAPPAPVIYPPYGYAAYPSDYGYHQPMYNPQLHQQQQQYYQQLYGSSSSSSTLGSPYYYGYSTELAPRGTFFTPQAQLLQGPSSYLYYPPPPTTPTQMEASFSTYPPPPLLQPTRHAFPSSTDSQTPQRTSTETDVGVAATSETPMT